MGTRRLPVSLEEPLLVTGAGGFIGTQVVARLLEHGFKNIRCFVRPSSAIRPLT